MYEHIVIAGAGQAAVQAVDTLRRRGFTGKLSMVGDEPWLPYQRPPLSKKYLAGALERERLIIRPAQFFAAHQVDTQLGRRVSEILRREQRVRLDDNTLLAYDALLLATGSRPRSLAAPGTELAGVHVLRTLADADRIRAECAPGGRMVIIGGGYIGLEVAATARGLGLEVTVLEMAQRVMSRVTCAQLSAFYESEHARQGVRILCNARVRALAADPRSGRVRAVLTEEGGEHPADIVIVAVGVAPADELARAAGIECENGIVTDVHCRTSQEAIYAAGDCASHLNRQYGRHLRLESVDNAFEQGSTVALNLLGTATAHDKVPWFWSDQFDLKLVIVGVSHGYDTVILRGAPASRSFSACYLRGGELIAIDTVNQPKDQMAARKLIAAHVRPNPDKLADPAIALKDAL
ncbi:MAG: pyridine nucleotide-disulfide oxidoreductase [Gammaproteobacteria bacterium]|nr:MAG: pyridine nucleotide-disulfide oxidoreductase [Gammaproteobacteria bacterium]TLZ02174.1 MAG: pyridine nucleotide-disulfide oxidoreductase [Gammaproteobacteria bacterium]